MPASAATLASRLDRDYTLQTLRWSMGDWYPVAGRYLYAEVTAVNTATQIAAGTGPDGQAIQGRYGDAVPAVGERWRVLRIVGGAFVFEDRS